MKRIFPQTHKAIKFSFKQTRDDFIVTEVPLFDKPTDKGNYLIVKVQKQDMSTMEMLSTLERDLQCFSIGYAGLKDKYATTTQYISIPLKFSRAFEKLRHPRIKVLESFRSREKLNIGDLKGNNFFIRLKDVGLEASDNMITVLDDIMRNGMPNYFGYQRFGRDSSNFEKARDVAQGELIMKDKKIHKIMLHAYQSYLFNDWLAERVRLSNEEAYNELNFNDEILEQLKNQKGLLKVLPGDIMQDHKGKFVNVTDLKEIRKPYKEQKIVPTGLLSGSKAWRAKGVAGEIEHHFDDLTVNATGVRREAIVYPKQIRYKYNSKEKTFELSFTLPKGAYATVLLENIANRDLSPSL